MNSTSTEKQLFSPVSRIEFLDGFRGIAILTVIFFHYYSRFAMDPRGMYPYDDEWSDFILFKYGFYGVQLFFAVSGFVISMTLLRSESIYEFGVRRFARLWPTMLLCSVITYVFLAFFPMYWPQQFGNFLPSLTFVDGAIWSKIFTGREFNWIDGAYWSLFVEVRFYFIAALVYFSNKKKFPRNLTLYSIFAYVVWCAMPASSAKESKMILDLMFIPQYMPWFLIGIAGHCYLRGGEKTAWKVLFIVFMMLLVSAVQGGGYDQFVVGAVTALALFLCIRFESFRRVLSAKWLSYIGVASYSLYLLHQFIGVTLISVVSEAFSIPPACALGLPVIFVGILIVTSRIIFRFWETPINRKIVEIYISRRRLILSRRP